MKKRLCLLVIAVLTATIVLVGCGAPERTYDYGPVEVDWADDEMDGDWDEIGITEIVGDYETDEGVAISEGAFDADPPDTLDGLGLPLLVPDDVPDRRLVYHATVDLQTQNFQPDIIKLVRAAEETGGYVVSSLIWGTDLAFPDHPGYAEFRFRIPSAELSGFIDVLATNFNVLMLDQGLQEFTRDYQEATWDIEDLQAEEARLLERLENLDEDDYDAIDALNDEIRDIQRAIRELEADQGLIDHRVTYSTVDVRVSEVIIEEEEEPFSLDITPVLIIVFVIMLLLIAITVLSIALLSKKRSEKKEDDNKT